MNKYKAKKTQVNGITFDSKAEAKRYQQLLLLQKAGRICDIELQVPFELQPKFKKNGKTYRPIIYIADFVYYDLEFQKKIIEDCKGFRTKDYMLKKKMFEYKYPEYELLEVS